MPDFNRQNFRAISKGLNLNLPVDDPRHLTGGTCPILTNVRAYQSGRFETRQGMVKRSITAATAADKPIHSIKRLNSPLSGSFTRIVGGGTKLWYGVGAALASTDTGYSGYPLSFIPFEPDQAPEPWMYAGDSAKMSKTNISGTTYSIGIAPPISEPTVSLAQPAPTDIDTFQPASPDGYAADNVILDNAGFSQINRTDSAKVTVGYAVPDGTNMAYTGAGWYTVYPVPVAPIDLQGIDAGEYVLFSAEAGVGAPAPRLVQSAQSSSSATTPISSIAYDSGITGLCSIQVTSAVNLTVNSMVQVSNNVSGAAAEYTRVESVSPAPDGVGVSFRCRLANTNAGHGHQTGDNVLGVFSFRVYCAGQPTAAGTISRKALRCMFKTVTAGGIGYIGKTGLTINAGISGTRPILDDDLLHLSVRLSNAASLTEGKIMLNVDPTDATFTANVYVWSFRASDFAQTVINQQTTSIAEQQRLINETIEQANARRDAAAEAALRSGHYISQQPIRPPVLKVPTGTTSSQRITSTGQAQWFELRLRVGEALRIGTDQTRTLQNVTGIRISLNVSTCANTDYADFDALWIGGTYGPDAGETGTPYVYRFRGRDRTTGARSNPGPPMRLGGGISPRRQSVVVSLPSMTTAADASWRQVNTVDIYRYGGTLPDWHYIGSVANNPAAATTLTFTDNLPDIYVATQPLIETDQDQPFPVIDKPRTGTCNVSGTTVTRTAGDNFSTAWAAGNKIEIAGIVYTLHNRPSSTTQLEIEESAAAQSAVTWTVYAPVLIGQPLPAIWGDLDGFIFACGDALNPGRLYWTNGNNPDASAQGNYLDVTSPSEPLVHGCIYDGRAFLWSTDRMFVIYPTFLGTIIVGGQTIGTGQSAPTPFRVLPIPNSTGLYARWCFCVGPKIWFLGKDGIYETAGGEPQSITDAALYPWFPNEGNPGQAVNGYAAPDLGYTNASTTAADFRLSWYDDQVRFLYRDTAGALGRLVYDTVIQAWWADTTERRITVEYGEEGTKDAYSTFKGASVHSLLAGGIDSLSNGTVYQITGTDDDGVAIACHIRFPSWDAGDGWADKQWGDAMLDVNPAGVAVTATPGFNNYVTLGAAATTAAATRTQLVVPCASSLGRNLALDVSWSGSGPLVYQWEASFLAHSFLQTNWQTVEQTNAGLHGWQHVRDGYIAHTSSADLTLTMNVDGVDYVTTISNSGGVYAKSYVIPPAVKGKMFRFKVSSTAAYRLYNADCEVRVRAWGGTGPYVNMKIPFEQPRV